MVFCNYCQKPMSFNPLEPNKPICRRCMRGPSYSKRALQASLDRENMELENDLMALEARAHAHERAQRALDRSSPYVIKTPCRPGCRAVPGPGMFDGGSSRIEEVIRERWHWPLDAGAPPTGSQRPKTAPQSSQRESSALADGASRTSQQMITAPQSSQHGGSAPADGASRRSEQVITAPQSSQPGGSALGGESARRSQHTIAAASSSHRSGTTRTVATNEKGGDWLSNVR
jgi:hypothetical protein